MNQQSVILPEIFKAYPRIKAAMSTKGTVSNDTPFGTNLSYRVGDDAGRVRESRRVFFSLVGTKEEEVIQSSQVHSNIVKNGMKVKPGEDCDGLISDQLSRFVAISVADCTPILLAAPVRGIVAAVHAGWRGTVQRIAAQAVDILCGDFDVPANKLIAWIGPCASACCYEVGEDVANLFSPDEVRADSGKRTLDLKMANRRQLMEAGLTPENIETHAACTICGVTEFHSYRRDGKRSGRMLAVIGIQ